MSTFPSLPDLVTNDSPVCDRQHIIVNAIEIIADLVHLRNGMNLTDLMVDEELMTVTADTIE